MESSSLVWLRVPPRCRAQLSWAAVSLWASGAGVALAQESTPPQPAPADSATAPAEAKLPPEQLEALVAPIALYPDDLLAQTLVASTYPLEIVQLHQWLKKHPELKEQALADSVAKQPWDPSIQSMAGVPEVVDRLANDIQWTTEMGNAFLGQQAEVMDAVQRMRKKAQDKGALESNEQQKVETKVIEEKTIIVVESSNPEVIYVPSYSPTIVYGPPIYPYPPIYYPPYPPGGAFISFGIGVMWGAAWGGSCCGCGWGGNDIDINVDNDFNNINRGDGNRGDGNRGDGNRGDGNRGDGNRGGGKWNHNPEHRGGTPYGDRTTADKFGGSARGDSQRGRQQGVSDRAGRTGVSDRSGRTGVSDRAAGGAGSANRGTGSAGVSNRASGSGSRGGGDKVGNRSIPSRSSPSSSRSGFSGGSRGYSGSSARASQSRGSQSMGSRGGARGGGRGGRR